MNKIVFRRLRTIISSTFFSSFFFHSEAKYQVSFKSGNEKKIKKLIPDSVKYSSGEFDQCKQPQRYRLLELPCLFFCFFWNDFFYQPLSQREPNGFTGHLVMSLKMVRVVWKWQVVVLSCSVLAVFQEHTCIQDESFSNIRDDPWTRWVPVVTAVDKKKSLKKKKLQRPIPLRLFALIK